MAKEKLTLDEFLGLVRTESPDLAIETATIDAFKSRASGINIPPGMVGWMQMKTGGDTSNGVEVFQEVPFPTKIIQDKRTRTLDYETQKQMGFLQKTGILAKARVAYVEFWGASARLAVLKEKHHWLRHHAELFKTTTLSDNTAKVHLLGVESETDLLENEVLEAEAALTEARNLLNGLVPSLAERTLVPVEPVLQSPKIPSSKNPFITWKEKELKAKKAELALAKQSYLPDVSVRFRTFEGMSASQVDRELMVGVTVPLLSFGQSRAQVKTANAEKVKAEAELKKISTTSQSMLSSFTKKAESLKSQFYTLKNKLIPRAKERVELMKNISPRTMEGLDEHKMVMTDYLDLRLKAVNLRVEYEKNFQEILQLTGNTQGGTL
ncbi:TolC family protein [bacterium]|nr:TolC family protein [bacterium]